MSFDVRKNATDAIYVVVGVGVLGYQQVQVRRHEATTRFDGMARNTREGIDSQTEALRTRTDGWTETFGSVLGTVSTQVLDAVNAVREVPANVDPRQWVEPVIDDIRTRVEPLVEQVKVLPVSDIVATIPGYINKAVEIGKARVQPVRN